MYIALALDPKALSGQEAVMEVLDDADASYGLLTDIGYQNIEKVNTDVVSVLAEGHAQNLFQITRVSESGSSLEEHMESFEYAYEINSIYE